MAAGEGPGHCSPVQTTGSGVCTSTELSPDVDLQPWSSVQGQDGLPDGVYLLASVIFQNEHLERPAERCKVNYGKDRELPLPEVKGQEMLQAAYQLAFDTLKCECAGVCGRRARRPVGSFFTCRFIAQAMENLAQYLHIYACTYRCIYAYVYRYI